MFAFHFDFSLPISQYKELLDFDKKVFPPYWFGINISRTNSILSFYASLNLFLDEYTNTVFYISLGILTFDFEFSISDYHNKKDY